MNMHITSNEVSTMKDEVASNISNVLNLPGSMYHSLLHKYGRCISCWEQINDALDNAYKEAREHNG